MVARHRGSDDETDRYSATERCNVEHWADALVVQPRMDSKGSGDISPAPHVPRSSFTIGVAPHRQVVPLTDVPRLRHLDGRGTRGQGPT
jgi:hypothetical protein